MYLWLSRFFEWATNWLPNQLELEYGNRAWIAVEAPLDVRKLHLLSVL